MAAATMIPSAMSVTKHAAQNQTETEPATMNTSKHATNKATPEPTASASTITSDPEAAGGSTELLETVAPTNPDMETAALLANLHEDDVTIAWRVEATVGKKRIVWEFKGVSTLNRLLALDFISLATEKINQELIDKVVVPVVSVFQAEANRRGLELAGPGPANGFNTLT
ncbi:MAG: hypothetical protein EAZ71_13325 [Verrucomicrobia bacterium]|nr:MAG: hypothetical protein EAZ71_13325 [Verrucomicrobiota bacterium]